MKMIGFLAVLCTLTFVCVQQAPAREKPNQVEIEIQFVAFDLTRVAKISQSGINVSALTALWTNGLGVLIATPKIVTRSGVEAAVRGTTEYIYPTEFAVTQGTASDTNDTIIASIVEPSAFETRRVGVDLTVLPEINPENSKINLTVNSQIVDDPDWKEYGGKYVDSNGQSQKAHMPQPFFHSYMLSTQVTVSSGNRILLGGGMPMRDSKRVVFAFLTAKILDI